MPAESLRTCFLEFGTSVEVSQADLLSVSMHLLFVSAAFRMNSVISSGQALLKNWGQAVRPAQGTSTVRPAQGNPAMAPKKVVPSRSPPSDSEPNRRKTGKTAAPEAPVAAPARVERVPSLSPPSDGEFGRRRGRGQAGAAATSEVAPAVSRVPVLAIATAPGPRFRDPAAKTEPAVKRESAAPELAAAPTARLPAPAAAPQELAPPVDTSAAPPPGEMQRMASALTRAASKSPEAQDTLNHYKQLSNKEKRNYYYNTFLPAHPLKDPTRLYTRSRTSVREDGADTEDFGWVDRDFIAGKLHLDNWRQVPEMKIKLEFQLAKYARRECEAAHLLSDDMDKYEYKFSLTVEKSSEKNKKQVRVQDESEIDEATHASAMAAIDGLDGGRALSGPARTARGTKRQLSPDDESKRDPAWLSTFKKECVRNFTTQKRAAEQAISSADECVRLVEQNASKIAGNDLLKAYLQTIKQQVELLKAADRKAASFEVAHSSTKVPVSEDAAKSCEVAWKDAANELKSAKTCFTSACLKMQTDLRAELAKA